MVWRHDHSYMTVGFRVALQLAVRGGHSLCHPVPHDTGGHREADARAAAADDPALAVAGRSTSALTRSIRANPGLRLPSGGQDAKRTKLEDRAGDFIVGLDVASKAKQAWRRKLEREEEERQG